MKWTKTIILGKVFQILFFHLQNKAVSQILLEETWVKIVFINNIKQKQVKMSIIQVYLQKLISSLILLNLVLINHLRISNITMRNNMLKLISIIREVSILAFRAIVFLRNLRLILMKFLLLKNCKKIIKIY